MRHELTGYGGSNETKDTRGLEQGLLVVHVTGGEEDQSDVGSAEKTEQNVVGLASTDGEDDSDNEPRPDEESNSLSEFFLRDTSRLVTVGSENTRSGNEDSRVSQVEGTIGTEDGSTKLLLELVYNSLGDLMNGSCTYSVTSAEVDDTSDELSNTTHPDHVTDDDVGGGDATRSELEEREEVQGLTEGQETQRVGAGELRLAMAVSLDGGNARGRVLLEVAVGEDLLGRHYGGSFVVYDRKERNLVLKSLSSCRK